MSDEKFDVPFQSPNLPAMLTESSRIKFNCYKGISCFNACCKMADITLAPYDILRLKDALGMSVEEFLKKHTVPFQMDHHGLPGIKLKTTDEGACLLLDGDNGCGVYNDRPTVCRYYPLGLLSMREKDSSQPQENFSLIREEHCKGHEEERELTVAEYREEQGVKIYDELNREWYRLILKKKSSGPTVGAPSKTSLGLFFMASYNMDMFRKFVMSEQFQGSYDLPPETYATVEKDDIALMKLGYDLLRHVLFGEKILVEKEGIWEKRIAERQEIWEARQAAERAEYERQQEERMREETEKG